MFEIGDMIVDTREGKFSYGAGIIISENKNHEGLTFYEVEFPIMPNLIKWSMQELITQVGIGEFELYPKSQVRAFNAKR